jgi:hypothetical protein
LVGDFFLDFSGKTIDSSASRCFWSEYRFWDRTLAREANRMKSHESLQMVIENPSSFILPHHPAALLDLATIDFIADNRIPCFSTVFNSPLSISISR